MRPQISIAPLPAMPDQAKPALGVFVDGILLRGTKLVIADGGDVLIVLEGSAVARDACFESRRSGERPVPFGTRLATDGQA